MNLLSGTLGVVAALSGRIDLAFYLMLAGAVFDFCDGLSARILGAYSPTGKELDSLSDVVTFGVLPAVMFYVTVRNLSGGLTAWCFIPFMIAVFSGLRLAKFNVDERQSHSFIGLPTPACAMICGSIAYFLTTDICSWSGWTTVILVLSVALSLLLVCELPMFSMKFAKDDSRGLKVIRFVFFALGAVITAIVLLSGLNWSLAVSAVFFVYILMNVILLFDRRR